MLLYKLEKCRQTKTIAVQNAKPPRTDSKRYSRRVPYSLMASSASMFYLGFPVVSTKVEIHSGVRWSTQILRWYLSTNAGFESTIVLSSGSLLSLIPLESLQNGDSVSCCATFVWSIWSMPSTRQLKKYCKFHRAGGCFGHQGLRPTFSSCHTFNKKSQRDH